MIKTLETIDNANRNLAFNIGINTITRKAEPCKYRVFYDMYPKNLGDKKVY